jgi:hypothetical protein
LIPCDDRFAQSVWIAGVWHRGHCRSTPPPTAAALATSRRTAAVTRCGRAAVARVRATAIVGLGPRACLASSSARRAPRRLSAAVTRGRHLSTVSPGIISGHPSCMHGIARGPPAAPVAPAPHSRARAATKGSSVEHAEQMCLSTHLLHMKCRRAHVTPLPYGTYSSRQTMHR